MPCSVHSANCDSIHVTATPAADSEAMITAKLSKILAIIWMAVQQVRYMPLSSRDLAVICMQKDTCRLLHWIAQGCAYVSSAYTDPAAVAARHRIPNRRHEACSTVEA